MLTSMFYTKDIKIEWPLRRNILPKNYSPKAAIPKCKGFHIDSR